MTTSFNTEWIEAVSETVVSYCRMIDAIVAQLSDAELHSRPAADINSVAIILRHLGGNLRSRWTDFLTTDGEKPDRNRETEFQEWDGDRDSLMAHFDAGWEALTAAIQLVNRSNIDQQVLIRGEPHSIPQALTRSMTHLTYHVGQMAIIARMVHDGDWRWLTTAPGDSAQHNDRTWGTNASRSVFGGDSDSK